MDSLRSASHTQRELGDELFAHYASSDNIEMARIIARMFKDGLLSVEVLRELEQKLRAGTITITQSDWDKMFGHLHVWDSDFKEDVYSLGADDNTKAEEFAFERTLNGYEALAKFEEMKRKTASLWALVSR